MDYGRLELADALGAQYVAGTLRGRARARFETLLPSHPALQRAVQQWQARLMPLTEVVPAAEPPARVWQQIERTLWPAPAAAAAAAELPWWQRLGLWRALSGVALAGVVGLAVLVATPPPALPPVVVVLQGTGAAPAAIGAGFVASFSGDGRALVARPLTTVALQSDRVLELWWAPAQGKPTSMGLLKSDGVTVLPRERLSPQLLQGIDHMAVSVEPPGGSPTGQPTGPVVFVGKLQL